MGSSHPGVSQAVSCCHSTDDVFSVTDEQDGLADESIPAKNLSHADQDNSGRIDRYPGDSDRLCVIWPVISNRFFLSPFNLK